MSIPPVKRDSILEALKVFDASHRDLPKWRGWEKNDNFKYAIVHEEQLYPVKEIVSLATSVPVSSFNGGAEANNYVRAREFEIQRIALPAHNEVIPALHDLLLSRAPQPVQPQDAYEALSELFALSPFLEQKQMENSEENHWQNRVRQARRELVDVGILDSSEHGVWKLNVRDKPLCWVEKTLVKDRADRLRGDNMVGVALWSPLRAQNGADIYRNMRLVQRGDTILHLTDNAAFTGISVADGFARTDFEGVAGTSWAGETSYRIQLRDFRRLEPPLTRSEIMATEKLQSQLKDIRASNSNLFYDPNLNLHQGGYLTTAPQPLLKFLDDVYSSNTGQHLLPNGVDKARFGDGENVRREASSDQTDDPERVWLYAPGKNASRWNDFRHEGIAAIGWDEVGDLRLLANRDEIFAKLQEVFNGDQSMVNATQCYDFAHRIKPGDWIFAKKGRREIVGFGVVKSAYRYEPERETYKHVLGVEWQKSGSWPTAAERMLSMKTVTDITDDEVLRQELEQLIGLDPEGAVADDVVVVNPPYTIADFAAETAISEEVLKQWRDRLLRKKHMIFQGPPGTGKTFVAERMARLLTGETAGFVETVQFHPSYSYEDFMQGIRPVVIDRQLIFQRMPGRFMQFCGRARRAHDDAPCVLIIDEINRGNLSRVFGELMYLLEYRDKQIPLAGDERPFSIPENVFIIGTMNTADRSIALVDHALRRRFSFIHVGPEYDVLRIQLEKNGLKPDGLITALKLVNAAIDDRNYEVGISFFLKDGAGLPKTLQDIWEGEIEPYLEEYFYDQPGKLAPLRWKKLAVNITDGS
jgi:MoxR-like ATPase